MSAFLYDPHGMTQSSYLQTSGPQCHRYPLRASEYSITVIKEIKKADEFAGCFVITLCREMSNTAYAITCEAPIWTSSNIYRIAALIII